MREEFPVAFAQVVQPRLTVGCSGEPVFGTFAVAGELPSAFTALARKGSAFGRSEFQLSLASHHRDHGVAVDVSEPVSGKHEVVA